MTEYNIPPVPYSFEVDPIDPLAFTAPQSASNDRTCIRALCGVPPQNVVAQNDAKQNNQAQNTETHIPQWAFRNWLKRQRLMLDNWEAELIASSAPVETLEMMERHKSWLDRVLTQL